MKFCCANCFADSDIKEIIVGYKMIGNCDYCKSQSVPIYSFEEDTTISDILNEFLQLFASGANLPPNYPKDRIFSIDKMLTEEIPLFACDSSVAYSLLKDICDESYANNPDLFHGEVGITALCDESFVGDNALLGGYSWEYFVEKIKHGNRFFTNIVNTDVFQQLFPYITKEIKQGSLFYRARLCKDSIGYRSAIDIKSPPKELAPAGRISSLGEPCLYLSDSVETTLHEIRAGLFDYVSVGELSLKQDITVIDLTAIDHISPFRVHSQAMYAINIRDLRKIVRELSRPLRRFDSQLDYLPTQYICDYIKSCGYSGIEYKSTMRKDGVNWAIFDDSLLELTKIRTHEVESIKYSEKCL